MSDEQNKASAAENEAPASSTDSGAAEPSTASSGESSGKASSQARQPAVPSDRERRSAKPRSNVLPLLVCLLLAGAIGWLAWNQERQQQSIADLAGGGQAQFDERFRAQQAQLNERISAQQDQLDERFDARQQQLAGEVEALGELVSKLQQTLDETRRQLQTQSSGMSEIRDQITNMRLQLENVDATSRDDQVWLLSEVESMLRLAQQRLVMARDTRTAIALMQSADEILRDIDDSTLFPVREAIADDISALRAVPELDVEGGFVQLNAVMDRIEDLPLRNVSREQIARAERVEPATENSTLDGWLQQLGDMVSVRRLDEPLQAMVSAEQGYYIRQNVRLLLEQAQLALWRGEDRIYTGNIDQALDYLETYFLNDDAGFRSVNRSLLSLKERPVSVQIPPAASGLTALRRVMDAYERGDGTLQNGER